MRNSFWASVLLAGPAVVKATSWTIAQNSSGPNFFDAWNFYAGIDANTTGNVLYQSKADAEAQGLAVVNSAGNAIIKVDNTTTGMSPTYGRASVKMLSENSISENSLVIMDAVHMPFGCSVWPAFWTQGVIWPDDGEIDIVENVNLATANQYALHTLDGCTHQTATTGESGQLVFTDCFNATNGDEGCIVKESKPNSYGAGFAQNGGGVYALLWNATGIMTWFFPRGTIPADVPTGSPNPDGWGEPSALYLDSSCPTSKYFGPQTIIFDITLCGNFAGAADVFNPSCTGLCTDLIATPTNFNDAYFEVAYVRTFTSGTSSSNSSPSQSGSSSNPANTKSAAYKRFPSTTDSLPIWAAAGVTLLALVTGYQTVTWMA